jgi:hypothetical protein
MKLNPMALCLSLIAILHSGAAILAAEVTPIPITGIDLLVDHKHYENKVVRIQCSEIYAADSISVLCKSEGQTVSLNSETMDRQSFRQALTRCAGYSTSCRGSVVGTVKVSFMGSAGLVNTTISFN